MLDPSHEDVSRVGIDRREGASSGHVQRVAPSRADRLENKGKLEGPRAQAGELYQEADGLPRTNL